VTLRNRKVNAKATIFVDSSSTDFIAYLVDEGHAEHHQQEIKAVEVSFAVGGRKVMPRHGPISDNFQDCFDNEHHESDLSHPVNRISHPG